MLKTKHKDSTTTNNISNERNELKRSHCKQSTCIKDLSFRFQLNLGDE